MHPAAHAHWARAPPRPPRSIIAAAAAHAAWLMAALALTVSLVSAQSSPPSSPPPSSRLSFGSRSGSNSASAMALAPATGTAATRGRPTTSRSLRPVVQPSDLLIVATIDGALHALHKQHGHRLWSSSPTAMGGPLVVSTMTSQRSAAHSLTYITEPMGSAPLYVHAPGKAITRLPVSLKQLVSASPFRAQDGTVYLGNKHTRFLAIDAATGFTVNDYGSSRRALPENQCSSSPSAAAAAVPIFLGRTEFHVSMFDPGMPLGAAPRWNVSYAEYGPARIDWLFGGADSPDPDSSSSSSSSATGIAVALGHNGDLVVSTPDGTALWAHRFTSPPLAVFDLAQDSDHLGEGAPGFHVMRRAPVTFPASILKGESAPATAYIGHIHGTLFALSSKTHFPMLVGEDGVPVAFPFVAKDQAKGKTGTLLLDGTVGAETEGPNSNTPEVGGDGDDEPETPYLYTCRVGNHAFPKCLVGVHPILNNAPVPADPKDSDDDLLLDDDPATASDTPIAAVDVAPAVPAHNPNANEPAPGLALVSPDGSLSTADPSTLGPAVGAIVVINDPPTSAAPPDQGSSSSKSTRVNANGNKVLKMPFDIDVEVEVSPQTGFGFGVAVTLVTGGLSLLVYRKLQAFTTSRRAARRKKAKEAAAAAASVDLKDSTESSIPPPPSPPQPPSPTSTSSPPSLSQTLATYVQQLLVHYLTQMGVGGPLGAVRPTPTPSAPGAYPHSFHGAPPATAPSADPAAATSASQEFSRPATPPAASAGGSSSMSTNGTSFNSNGSNPAMPQSPAPHVFTQGTPLTSQPLAQPDGTTHVGRLVLTDQPLGYGSHGTVVYRGRYDGRDVAVKRLLRDFYDVASHEVSLLVESDDHYNVIRYYCKEECDRFLYIGLELCDASLADVVEGTGQGEVFDELRKGWVAGRILYQVLCGLHHLHGLKIVHRDLKPHNILIVRNKRQRWNPAGARVLISDFGLCKRLELDQSSFGNTVTHHGGTFGWRAPELLTHPTAPTTFSSHSSLDKLSAPPSATSPTAAGSCPGSGTSTPRRRLTRALDIFSLGCLFYYVLTGGDHPFGDRFVREINILRDQFSLDALDPAIVSDATLARDMISGMIAHDPEARPTTGQLLVHPFFWSPARRLNFLADVSDRFEVETKDPPSALVQILEHGAENVVEGGWTDRIDRSLANNLGKFRKYRGESVVDLLRALRNKKHHYADLPPNVRRALGPLPEGFLAYFTSRFPNLFLHVYRVVKETDELRRESVFSGYFEPPDQGRGEMYPG